MTITIASRVLAGVLLVCAPASAQNADDEVRGRLREGLAVLVTDAQGTTFAGRVLHLSHDTLTLQKGRERFLVPFSEIQAIDHQKDTLRNGALMGAGLGASLGAWAVAMTDNSQAENPFCGFGYFDDCSPSNPATVLVGFTLVGTALGAGIDALINRGSGNIYTRKSHARLTVSPAFGPRTQGAAFSLSW